MERLKVWMLEENSSSIVMNYYSAPQGKANVYTAKLNTFTLSQCPRNIIPITYLNAQKRSVCASLLSWWFKMLLAYLMPFLLEDACKIKFAIPHIADSTVTIL